MLIRSATEEDLRRSRDELPELRPDRWRSSRNARSFVAVEDGVTVGYCLAVDNVFHPDSRVLHVEVVPAHRRRGIGCALLRAQLDVSTNPPHLKVRECMSAVRSLAAKFGAVPVQACPPWRYPVTEELRQWPGRHRGPTRSICDDEREQLLDLYAAHYRAQHASWSPAAEPDVLRREFAADFEVGSADGFDSARSAVLERDGQLVASALVWPYDTTHNGYEVGLETYRHGDPHTRADMEQCLAHVIEHSADGEVLLIDSHLTEDVESALVRGLPRRAPEIPAPTSEQWMAILALPVAGGPAPIRLPVSKIPPAATWVRDF